MSLVFGANEDFFGVFEAVGDAVLVRLEVVVRLVLELFGDEGIDGVLRGDAEPLADLRMVAEGEKAVGLVLLTSSADDGLPVERPPDEFEDDLHADLRDVRRSADAS